VRTSITPLLDRATYLFDDLHRFWKTPRTHKIVTGGLVLAFLVALAGIELNRLGLLPQPLTALTPTNHFYAVDLAFSLVLILEVIGLIFVLPCSVSKAVGKQFEILALILLRSSFKELVHFPEPVVVTEIAPLLRILADGMGALVIFILLGFYYGLQRVRHEIREPEHRYRFVAWKKVVALLLLLVFGTMGLANGWDFLTGTDHPEFFPTFYTVLIFSDILLVLISQQYLPAFHAVFRNSGYALSTLFMRLALAAPPFYNAAIGIVAATFAVFLALAYNRFYAQAEAEQPAT
jgi:uncharacterized membrane protein YsdA (DUF1294 family)